jgi:hypothetical protein
MENKDIIKLAVKLTEENNTIYKQAARNQAFMIKAKDSLGSEDTFITVAGPETADDWMNQFTTAGFSNVVVSPFRTSGNLQFSDVDPTFFNEISKRAKWRVEHSPTGLNTWLTDYNPYAGSDKGFDRADSRTPTATSHSIDSTNEYQKLINETLLPSEKYKVFAGWFNGSLMDWIIKMISLDKEIEPILKKKYAYLYGNAPLQKYILDKDKDPETFVPTKFEIKTFGISLYSLYDIISHSDIDLDDFPEKLIEKDLQSIVDKAKSHKYHKQYEQEDMDKFQQKEIDDQYERDKDTWNFFSAIMRGLAR